MEHTLFTQQKTHEPLDHRPNNLYAPVAHDGGARGRNWNGHVRGSSLYTEAVLHPRRAALLAAGVGLAAVAGVQMLRIRKSAHDAHEHDPDHPRLP